MKRRKFLSCSLGAAAGVFASAFSVKAATTRRIEIRATKFEFTPSEFTVRKGEPVTLVLSTPDFPHGFNLPDFNLRRDLIPNMPLELTFTPDKAGRFTFLCDNFCGEGHEKMNGTMEVTG